MSPDTDPPLTTIEGTCQQCGQPVGASPSPDFCSEDCQQTWQQHQTTPGTTPSGQPPSTSTPVQPLGWLAQPSPDADAPGRSGHEVLDNVATFLARFSVFPSQHCAPTLALWYAHTHAVEQFYVTPRLVLDSAEPGSGKTRVLEVAQHLVRAPEMTISATPAALFRLVSLGPITILFDEVDAIFNPKNGGTNEDLRGLLNAGYKRSATIARCVGDTKNMKVERFPVYAPAALAGIAGALPATITTRAITIHMRRRRPDEPVEPFRERHIAQQAQPLRDQLATWTDSITPQLSDANPPMPEGVTDRAAEIWEPLLTLADAAGDHWPHTARTACQHFVLEAGLHTTSPGIQLLADLQALFTRHNTDRLPTTSILTQLCELDESPWGDLEGKPLDARRLAKELAPYNVKPGPLKVNGDPVKGYKTTGPHGLTDAWDRYLPPRHPTPTTIGYSGYCGYPAGQAVTDPNPVTDTSVTPESSVTPLTRQVTAVTAVTAHAGPTPGGPRP
ncbi:MAG: DUF3631 domain-containing protein [Pseudonocardiales bacterium]|nr:DUF3631 domain-containing protein [Pseudonocardiales bacterium]